MIPEKFMSVIEEQLKRVRSQYLEAGNLSKFYDITPDELIENAKTWFLRTMLNTDLIKENSVIPSVEYIAEQSLNLSDPSTFELKYPSIVWMISLLEKEQIDWLFGVSFQEKFSRTIEKFKKFQYKGFKTSVNGGDTTVQ